MPRVQLPEEPVKTERDLAHPVSGGIAPVGREIIAPFPHERTKDPLGSPDDVRSVVGVIIPSTTTRLVQPSQWPDLVYSQQVQYLGEVTLEIPKFNNKAYIT